MSGLTEMFIDNKVYFQHGDNVSNKYVKYFSQNSIGTFPH